jgi:hypothetical protein
MAPRKRPGIDAINPNPLAPTEPQQGALPVGQQDAMTVSRPDVKPVKGTFYLAPVTFEALGEARVKLRALAAQEDRSAIVDAALALALEDLEHNGAASQLAMRLAKR